jgi:hypothetical protein
VLRVRAYGDGLRPGDPVRFTVSATTLGLSATTVDGRAFEAVRIPFPTLSAGDHRLSIDAERVGSAALRDRLIRTVHVVPNRLTALRTFYEELDATLSPPTGVDVATYLVTDAGRGSLVPILQELAGGGGARFDRLAAAEAARAVLADEFGVSVDQPEPTGFDRARYQDYRGIALLPYATPSLSLAAEAAIVVPDQIDAAGLRRALRDRLLSATNPEVDKGGEPEDLPTREELIISGAALAALGDDVLDHLRALAASEPALSVRERLWLALGYLASADETAARTIERALLSSNGRALGPWVKLDAGNGTDEMTGLMLLLSAGLGDPISGKLSRYLTDHPSLERPFALEQLGYARAMLDRLPRAAATFAWTVDGERHVETLEPGESFAMSLTPAQQRGLVLERVAGALVVATTSIVAATPADLPSHPSVTITRRIDPEGDAPADRLVHVTINVTFRGAPSPGCYTVTDLVPSGLAPVATVAGWPNEEGGLSGRGPYLVDGQRVSWCVDPVDNHPLTYAARVVTPGTYTWEPAVVQFETDASIGNATATTSYTIR